MKEREGEGEGKWRKGVGTRKWREGQLEGGKIYLRTTGVRGWGGGGGGESPLCLACIIP